MKAKKFTKVFHRYNKLIRKVVINATGDWNLAEEICQQVFLKYFEHMDHIEDDLIQAWLMFTAKNKICDYYRRQKTRNSTRSIDQMKDAAIVLQDNTEVLIKSMADTQLTERIMESLYEYRKEWYDIVEAVCIMGMSHEEAAKYLQISPEILRARLFRARRYIRKHFGEEYKNL